MLEDALVLLKVPSFFLHKMVAFLKTPSPLPFPRSSSSSSSSSVMTGPGEDIIPFPRGDRLFLLLLVLLLSAATAAAVASSCSLTFLLMVFLSGPVPLVDTSTTWRSCTESSPPSRALRSSSDPPSLRCEGVPRSSTDVVVAFPLPHLPCLSCPVSTRTGPSPGSVILLASPSRRSTASSSLPQPPNSPSSSSGTSPPLPHEGLLSLAALASASLAMVGSIMGASDVITMHGSTRSAAAAFFPSSSLETFLPLPPPKR